MSALSPLIPNANPQLAQVAACRQWAFFHRMTLALVGIFFLFTIRDGHTWGDDYFQYLQHADNIFHMRPYADTGYIYNPQNAVVGPRAYPPGFPVVLAPVIGLFGLNLYTFKVLNVLFFLIALAIEVRLFANDLRGRQLWICLVLIGFCPVYWELKDVVASENLFTPLWYATLLAADDWYRRQRVYRNQTIHGLILGFLIFATCATRAVGIVLIPAIVVCEVMLARKVSRVGMSALLTAVSLLALERVVLPTSGAGYFEQLRDISLKTLLSNAYSDTTSLSLVWQNGGWDGLRKIAGVVFSLIAAIGFVRTNLPRPTPLGVALAGYFALIVVWPSADGVRMILPLLPGYVFYVVRGVDLLPSLLRSPNVVVPRAISIGLLLFSLLSQGLFYSTANFGRLTFGVETGPARELFQFIRNHTEPNEVCLFYKPRALAFYTGRSSSAYPLSIDEQGFWDYARSIGADLIIVRDEAADLKSEDSTAETKVPFAARDLEEVFQNSKFYVYRWNASVGTREIQTENK